MDRSGNSGVLYICATPIGNLEDMTLRAIRILKEVDLIAAEDTRHTLKLLNHFGISKPLTSYFEHNQRLKGEYILSQLQEGKNVALVSDAGMPGISDPGTEMVRLAIENDIRVVPIPGVSAGVTALSISGLATDRFIFEGFIPRKKKERLEFFTKLKNEERTIILYETPHRIKDSLKDMLEVFGDRKIAVARELTKQYEEVLRGRISEIDTALDTHNTKGEFALVLEGNDKPDECDKDSEIEELSITEKVDLLIKSGMDKKEAMRKIAQENNLSRRTVYNLYLEAENKMLD